MSTQTTEVHRHFDWTVADRLRKAREEAGLTQQQLADAIDVSQRTISNYESTEYRGARKPLVVKQWAMRTKFDYGLIMWGSAGDPDDGGTRSDMASDQGGTRSRCSVLSLVA